LVTHEEHEVIRIARAIIREEVTAALAAHEGGSRRKETAPGAAFPPEVDRKDRVQCAEYVLREAGRPLHVRELAKRMYALGFEHRWPPKHADQLERSLNSLASPSQLPERFERVAPRTLRLL
jgi:hypothetical protein